MNDGEVGSSDQLSEGSQEEIAHAMTVKTRPTVEPVLEKPTEGCRGVGAKRKQAATYISRG